jgi:hypothetical protein
MKGFSEVPQDQAGKENDALQIGRNGSEITL